MSVVLDRESLQDQPVVTCRDCSAPLVMSPSSVPARCAWCDREVGGGA